MKPHINNFCGGNYSDWLEVMLISECNGKCSWCIEKKGFHPEHIATWETLAVNIISSGKKNIILLGGEPTLYKDLCNIVNYLSTAGLNIYITTNGSRLTKKYIKENLVGIKGINISIHSEHPDYNEKITGIKLDLVNLKEVIDECHSNNISVRLNCNLIKNYVDSKIKIKNYIAMAAALGADSVRFAELKDDNNNFVDMYKIFGGMYHTNNEPFEHGCNHNVVINGMKVNLRQMCGSQTNKRKLPCNVERVQKKIVLYYDGNFYEGWQRKGNIMKEDKLKKLELKLEVLQKKIELLKLKKDKSKTIIKENSSSCCY